MNPANPVNPDRPEHPQGPAEPAIGLGLTVSQQKYLPAGGGAQELHAVVTVQVTGAAGAAPGPALAEVLVVDCSSSMDRPPEKFREAKKAAVAALQLLPDGTPFTVVAGTHEAVAAYPPGGAMAVADATTRAAATAAVHELVAAGGTCLGRWLDLARRELAAQSAPIRHALLLTDGRDEHGHFLPLAGVLADCAGQFVCDAWGIGTDWDAHLLLDVAAALHGSADAVRVESDLAAGYRRLVRALLAKTVPELTLTVDSLAPGARLRYVKQTFPHERPMTPEPDRPGTYVTRAWGEELRRFHVCLTVDPEGELRDQDLLAAAVGVHAPAGTGIAPPAPQPLVVHWTNDPALSGLTDGQVAHARVWEELGTAVADATDAHHHGRTDRAEALLGRAVALAHRAGARRLLAELARLVEIHDPAAGRVTLRSPVDPVDFQLLMTASSHTTQGPDGSAPAALPRQGGELAACPVCHRRYPARSRYCGNCGAAMGASS
ncbi:VWA domain-containing protein [Streptomyces sp. NPDC020983]|uniref:VWA domain-containing protein n=1 Tax=Streptomyces sp. NPDC020983 TaxID=3365106 RepID=UPI00379D79E1